MWGKGALLPDHSLSLPEESGSDWSGKCMFSEQSVSVTECSWSTHVLPSSKQQHPNQATGQKLKKNISLIH